MSQETAIFEERAFRRILCRLNGGVGQLILNRTDVHNAFDEVMMSELIKAVALFAGEDKCRVMVLKANGKHFSAGADLNWMRQQKDMTFDENIAEAGNLARLMKDLDNFPKPTLVQVQGGAYGGALGLICCCDIAVATPQAGFCLSEVKLGLIPAVISPYVIRTIGSRASRRYMLTAELIGSEKARQLQIIHEIGEDLDEISRPIIDALLANSPQGMAWSKQLVSHQAAGGVIDRATMDYTSERIARIRISAEGQEGLNAFFEKRKPNWNQ